jgi:uncharacterized Tic20 family protein
MPMETIDSISAEDRGLAVATHLSGLAGYIIPLGGIIVPIIIWVVKKESAVISSIAKQAILLNVAIFVLFCAFALLWITIILIPVAILAWIALGIVAIALPIIGAVKASEGKYYKYPVIGIGPTG